ncbi:MAG: lytic transglycosylase domain-containing protein [Candidatus Gallimonas sp.]
MIAVILILTLFPLAFRGGIALSYPRPYRSTVTESRLDPCLVYAVIKAESGFNERALSSAGAVGLMQLKPSTAEFICKRSKIDYREDLLFKGEYNVRLGCMYLFYLLDRFPAEETAVAAYNAGEGTVSLWLQNPQYSDDGRSLKEIPYSETRAYVKKVLKFRKIYDFFY